MIDRQRGKIIFECDACGDTLETEQPRLGYGQGCRRSRGLVLSQIGARLDSWLPGLWGAVVMTSILPVVRQVAVSHEAAAEIERLQIEVVNGQLLLMDARKIIRPFAERAGYGKGKLADAAQAAAGTSKEQDRPYSLWWYIMILALAAAIAAGEVR